jgi:Family of unknown function (DUF6152)
MKLRSLLPILTIGLALAGSGQPLLAHHSTALFEMESPITVTGVVKRFEWSNPHAFIYVDVKGDKGNVETWAIEMTSLNQLKAYGWARDMVKPGDVISCTGGRAKDGLPSMLSSRIKLSDGRNIRS